LVLRNNADMILGQLIKSHRKVEKIGVRKLAKAIGIDHTVLHRFENGSNIKSDQLSKIYHWMMHGDVRKSDHA